MGGKRELEGANGGKRNICNTFNSKDKNRNIGMDTWNGLTAVRREGEEELDKRR